MLIQKDVNSGIIVKEENTGWLDLKLDTEGSYTTDPREMKKNREAREKLLVNNK